MMKFIGNLNSKIHDFIYLTYSHNALITGATL
jgi:hypothetical protein